MYLRNTLVCGVRQQIRNKQNPWMRRIAKRHRAKIQRSRYTLYSTSRYYADTDTDSWRCIN